MKDVRTDGTSSYTVDPADCRTGKSGGCDDGARVDSDPGCVSDSDTLLRRKLFRRSVDVGADGWGEVSSNAKRARREGDGVEEASGGAAGLATFTTRAYGTTGPGARTSSTGARAGTGASAGGPGLGAAGIAVPLA